MTAASSPAELLRYGQVDQEYVARLEGIDPAEDGPVWMLNLMRYRDLADYPAGHPDAGRGLSGREADDRYAPLEILGDLGAAVVLFGEVTAQPSGDEAWERVAIVRYPTMRSFLEMQDRPDFVASHVHKDAGMLRTIIAACRPVAGAIGSGRRLLVELLGPSEQPAAYDGRLILAVDGTPVGDGRRWAHLVVTDMEVTEMAGTAPVLVPNPQSSAVVVDALIQELP